MKKQTGIAFILTLILLLTACGNSNMDTNQTVNETADFKTNTLDASTLDTENPDADNLNTENSDVDSPDIDSPDADIMIADQGKAETVSLEMQEDTNLPSDGENNLMNESENIYGALTVNGTSLTDSAGNIVQLRGISSHGLSWFPEYVNKKALQQMKEEWGCNVFRLAMYTAEYNGYCVGSAENKTTLENLIDSAVTAAEELEMYIIIDWHILSDQNPLQYKEEAIAFFEKITDRYKDKTHILYEICNEPNGSTTWEDVKTYAKDLITVIRKNTSAIILIGTTTWSQDIHLAALDPITQQENIMYTLHFYAATHKDDLRKRFVNAVTKGLPVFVSEFGICDASGNGGIDENEANKWLDLMNEYHISYVLWNLSNKQESSAMLLSSCTKTSDFTESDLSQCGKWFIGTRNSSTLENGNTTTINLDADNTDTDNTDADNTDTENTDSKNTNTETTNITNNEKPQTEVEKDSPISVTLLQSWESEGLHYYQYSIDYENTTNKNINSWEINLSFSQEFTISDYWNGSFFVSEKNIHILPLSYNGTIAPGSSLSNIGFIIGGEESLHLTHAAINID
ncbi:cellulase family glycosylhydrolase [Lachnospiraceae bacterium OttesenSCG-928-D06]|nr:cellulase family glycosylhydrolase [Lachnospiraceae bacterium OttesenSCG-928-D06]